MLSSLFFINDSGAIIIERHWKGIISRSIGDRFFKEIKQTENPSNVNQIGDSCLVHVHKGDVYIVAVVKQETPPLMVTEFLNTLGKVLKEYIGKINENNLKLHFSTVYQLLDEMLDDGFPITTEISLLMDLVKPPETVLEAMASLGHNTGSGRSPVPWRKYGVKYLANEIFFDVCERVNAIVDANGSIIFCEVLGTIKCNCKLSGMPDLTLKFRDPSILDDVSFHPCIRYSRFEQDRTISFVPPDGNFELMTYRVIDNLPSTLPIYVRPQISMKDGKMSFQMMCGIKNAPGNKFNSTLGQSPNGMLATIAPLSVEKIVVEVPLADQCANNGMNVEQFNVTTCSVGDAGYDAITKKVTWQIGKLSASTLVTTANGTSKMMNTAKTPALTATAAYTTKDNINPIPPAAVLVHFELPASVFSKVKVDSVEVKKEKYTPFKGVRYCAESANIEFRTS